MLKRLMIIIISTLFLLVPTINAEIVVLNHTHVLADTDIATFAPDTNFGTGTLVSIKKNFDAPTRAWFMFNISSIPSNSIILDAELGLFMVSAEDAMFINSFHFFSNSSWDELNITYNNNPCGNAFAIIGSSCNSTPSSTQAIPNTPNVRYFWNITSSIRHELQKSNDNVTTILQYRGLSGSFGVDLRFTTREGAVVNNRPILNISFESAVDATPPTITINTPQNNTDVNDVPLNFELNVIDDSNFNVTCVLRNATNIFDEKTFPQLTNTNLIFSSVQNQTQTINFNVTCFDNSVNNNSKTELLTITIDTLNPLITINQPINNSVFNSDITVDLSCFDELITEINYTFFNSSNVIKTFQNTSTPDNNVLTINDIIGTSGLGDGVYNMDIVCVNGVNQDTELLELNIDFSSPTITSTSISGINFTEGEAVQINASCSDSFLTSIEAFNNETGSFISVNSVTFSPPQTFGVLVVDETAIVGTIGHLFECSDSVGNSINSSILIYTGSAIIAPPQPALPLQGVVEIVGMMVLIFLTITFFTKMIKK